MNIKTLGKVLGFTTLLLASGNSQAVMVNFSGNISTFNPGPFAGGENFFGSFEMDESVVASGSSIKIFTGAMDNFTLNVGSFVFTGENGNIRQFSSAGGTSDFFSVSIDNIVGTLTGNVGSSILTGFKVDWRGANLFDPTSQLANNLTIADFSYTRTTIEFDNTVFNTAINNASDITFGPSAVPVPAAAWLFGSGLLGLVGIARRRH